MSARLSRPLIPTSTLSTAARISSSSAPTPSTRRTSESAPATAGSEEGNQFTISGNGRYITLKAKFLNARTAGETYTLNVKTTSGEWTSCNFRILTTAQAASSPRTGDNSNIGLWLVFMAVSGGAVAVALPKLKKGKD